MSELEALDSDVEGVDKEKVSELVSELTVEDLEPVIAEAGPEKLAAIKEAEKAGKNRVGVLEAISDREEELGEEEEPDLEAMSKAELKALAKERELEVPSKAGKAKLIALLGGGSPDGNLPIIRVGDWVRLAAGDGVPDHLVNRDAVVVRALVKRAEGGDNFSPTPYEFQDGSELFLVRVRDTGTELELTRDAFRSHGTQQVELGVA